MLLEQLVRYHVQSQALVWRELLSWPLAMMSMWDDAVYANDTSLPHNVTSMAARASRGAKAA